MSELYNISSALNEPSSYISSSNKIALSNSSRFEWFVLIPFTRIEYVKLSGTILNYFVISS